MSRSWVWQPDLIPYIDELCRHKAVDTIIGFLLSIRLDKWLTRIEPYVEGMSLFIEKSTLVDAVSASTQKILDGAWWSPCRIHLTLSHRIPSRSFRRHIRNYQWKHANHSKVLTLSLITTHHGRGIINIKVSVLYSCVFWPCHIHFAIRITRFGKAGPEID